MNKIFNWTFGSIFRTLGRFICYILIGGLLVFLGLKLPNSLRYRIGSLLGIDFINASTYDIRPYVPEVVDSSTTYYNEFSFVVNNNTYNVRGRYVYSNISNGFGFVYKNINDDTVIFFVHRSSNSPTDPHLKLSGSALSYSPDNSTWYGLDPYNTFSGILSTSSTLDSSYFSSLGINLGSSISTDIFYKSFTKFSFTSSRTFYENVMTSNNWCLLSFIDPNSNFTSLFFPDGSSISPNCPTSSPVVVTYDSTLFNSDFLLFYNFDSITQFNIFSSYDFTEFTDFEKLIFTLLLNILYLIFVFFVIYIILKVLNKLCSWLF